MKYLARTTGGEALVGDEDGFVPLAAAEPGAHTVTDVLPAAAAGSLRGPSDATATSRDPSAFQFGPSIAHPGTLLGIGLNYADHAEDLDEVRPDEPASFIKPAATVVGPGGPIRLPPAELSERVTAEGELAVVIGRTCRDVAPEDVDDVIAGYAPVIDVTAEDILAKNPRFLTRAKSFDSFLVIGPWIAVPDEPLSLRDRVVSTIVNGETVAQNSIVNMLHSPRALVAFHSQTMTFRAGDVVSTGTPGAGVIEPGDRVAASVDGIGEVTATVMR